MTPAELKAALAALHWSPGDLAHHLGQSVNRVRNWVRQDVTYRVPPDVAAWLTRRVAFHRRMMEDDPPPGRTTP